MRRHSVIEVGSVATKEVDMRQAALILLAVLTIHLSGGRAVAAPARFWISPFPDRPFWQGAENSETLDVNLNVDRQQTNSKTRLYIWAQPAREVSSAEFKQLNNMTLDVISTMALVDFLDQPPSQEDESDERALLDNPPSRFSTFRDGATTFPNNQDLELELTTKTLQQIQGGAMDAIFGLQGFNLTAASTTPDVGIGPDCNPGANMCRSVDGDDFWRIGSFSVQSIGMLGSVGIHLQIGAGGMSHIGGINDSLELTSDTNVVFSSTSLTSPVYNAGPNGERQTVDFVNDASEVLIHIIEPNPGDFDLDGFWDGGDFLAWQRGLSAGPPSAMDLEDWKTAYRSQIGFEPDPGDFDFDGDVDGDDFLTWQRGVPSNPPSAIDLGAWQTHYGSGVAGGSATVAVPEPQSLLLASSAVILGLFFGGIGTRCGSGVRIRRIVPRSTVPGQRRFTRAGRALLLAVAVLSCQQARGAITVDPAANNVVKFPIPGPGFEFLSGTLEDPLELFSDRLAVGHNSGTSGILRVDGGSSIISNPPGDVYTLGTGIVIGDDDGFGGTSTGVLTVSGVNSTVSANTNLAIGGTWDGTLNVESGGRVDSNVSWIGYLSDSTGNVIVTGGGSVWEPRELSVGVEGSSSGSLNVSNGGRVGYTSHVSGSRNFIGFAEDSAGVVTVSGTGSTFFGAEEFTVGLAGEGTLNIASGGSVVHNFNPNGPVNYEYVYGTGTVIGHHIVSTGTVNVHGANSTFTANHNLAVGGHGSGTLNVEAGGSVNSNISWVGYHPTSTGTATVTGAGSNWEPEELAVGAQGGNGDLMITNGGRVGFTTFIDDNRTNPRTSYIGFNQASEGVVTVDGPNSIFNGSDQFAVGQGGTGTLNITNGGSVVHQFDPDADAYQFEDIVMRDGQQVRYLNGMAIGRTNNSNGTVNVSGSNSSLTSNKNLTVGGRGTGTLNVEAGGYVRSNVSWVGYEDVSTGNATVTGPGSVWEPNELAVGRDGSGTLDINSGGRVGFNSFIDDGRQNFRTSYIGFGQGSIGEVNVDGQGSTFNGSEIFAIGHVGDGTLNITNGGRVVHNFNPAADAQSPATGDPAESGTGIVVGNSFFTTGIVNVEGTNSTFISGKNLTLGRLNTSTGTLNVRAGGSAESNVTWLGYEGDSTGSATITGAGSTWEPHQLMVGYEGDGTVDISNGGLVGYDSYVPNSNTIIGYYADSTGQVTVDGPGSTLYGGRIFRVGQNSEGTLNVTGGGSVVHSFHPTLSEQSPSNGLVLGNSTGSTGTASVTGSNSSLTAGKNLAIGRFGTGTLNVVAGGTVNSNISWIGYDTGSIGTATVMGAGSQWNAAELYVGGNTSSGGGTGFLTVKDGGVVNVSGNMTVWTTGTLKGDGQIFGNLTSSGRVAPGNSPGILTINGDYTQTVDSILEIEIGGLTPGPGSPNIDDGHDQLVVSGVATLGGTLEFLPINTASFVPTIGQEVTFLSANSVVGSPAAVIYPGLEDIPGVSPNIGFRVIKNATDVRLQYVEKDDITFIDNTGGAVDAEDWNEMANWIESDMNRVPIESDAVTLNGSQTGAVQRVDVKFADGFAHSIAVEDEFNSITLGVSDGWSLSAATGAVRIGSNATLELDNGTVGAAQAVVITENGMLTGQGTVIGTVNLGIGGGSEAMLSPSLGAMHPEVGNVNITGDYTQGSDGTLEVDLLGTASDEHDTLVIIDGMAELQGTLSIDLSDTATAIEAGAEYTLITADGGTGSFDQIIVNDPNGMANDVYFSPFYGTSLVGPGEGLAAIGDNQYESGLRAFSKGDADGDGLIDGSDAKVFAAVLINSTLQGFEIGREPNDFAALNFVSAFDFYTEGSVDDLQKIDVDDIPGFIQAMADSQGTSLAAANANFAAAYAAALTSRVPEPTTGVLLSVAVVLLLSRRKTSFGG